MKFPKNKRFKSEENIKAIKDLPCFICGKSPPSDAHHIQSVKSGGPDIPSNLLNLCRTHHRMVHDLGIKSATEKFNLPIDISGIYPFRTDV